MVMKRLTRVARRLPMFRGTTAYALLDRVKTLALEEPKRIRMNIVCARGEGLKKFMKAAQTFKAQGYEEYNHVVQPSCGTVGCVAGWTLALLNYTHPNIDNDDISIADANNALGLTFEQARELFYPTTLLKAPNQQTKKFALKVVAHITEFQAKYEDQLRATPVVRHRATK